MKHLQIAVAALTSVAMAVLVAQPRPLSNTASVQLNVNKLIRMGDMPQPFDSVGLFDILVGDTPIDKACLSRSSKGGKVNCKIACDPTDSTDITLLVRAPGADKVPGYESPVSVELEQRGCVLDQQAIVFTYKTLELALGELLTSDPQIALAVTGTSAVAASGDVFGQLRSFEASAPSLRHLATANNPNLERFSRIMRDAEISTVRAPASAKNQVWRKSSADFSIGTRSILLQRAATRSLGEDAGKALVPVTKNPRALYSAKIGLTKEITKKSDKSKFDLALESELRRTTPASVEQFKKSKDLQAVDWAHINRAQIAK